MAEARLLDCYYFVFRDGLMWLRSTLNPQFSLVLGLQAYITSPFKVRALATPPSSSQPTLSTSDDWWWWWGESTEWMCRTHWVMEHTNTRCSLQLDMDQEAHLVSVGLPLGLQGSDGGLSPLFRARGWGLGATSLAGTVVGIGLIVVVWLGVPAAAG